MNPKEKNFELEEASSIRTHKFHDSCAVNAFEISHNHRLIALLYELELSILCLLRKNAFKNVEKPIFKIFRTGKFNNIRICLDGEYVCIKVQHADTYFIKRTLNFN